MIITGIVIAIIIIIIAIIPSWDMKTCIVVFIFEKPTFFSLLKFIHSFIYVSVMRMTKL